MVGSQPPPTAAVPPAHRRGLRFDRRLLLVYGLLLLDVVVIGSTSLQHVWQPANLIDKVLQNHNTPLDATVLRHSFASQYQLPVAVKRELGMSCCCGWLALAVMGTLSLLLSYSPSAVPTTREPSFVAAQPYGPPAAVVGRRRMPTAHSRDANTCSACSRTLDEVELQVKLKYLLVAVATFCVFFALNLVVQIHGRFQQSKVTVTAFKTFAANDADGHDPTPVFGLCETRETARQQFDFYDKLSPDDVLSILTPPEAGGSSPMLSRSPYKIQGPVQPKDQAGAAGAREHDGSGHPQSPSYFYWRDFFFWVELGRECFFDGEVQLSGLWVLLHAAALMGGRGALRSRSVVLPSTD